MPRIATQPSATQPLILRIVGDSRSGTTIISTLLGQIPSATYVGELDQLWRAFTTPDWRCSCGSLIASCPFWCDVRARSQVDTDFDVESLRATIDQHLRVRPRRLAALALRAPNARLADYVDALHKIYRAIAVTAASTVIIDSSKSAPELMLMLRTSTLQIHPVHVVRDPRAVAHSRSRPTATMQPRAPWMAPARAFASSAKWAVRNALLGVIIARYASVGERLRYEDFVTHPASKITGLRLPCSVTPVTDRLSETEPLIAIGPRHVLSGNARVLRQSSEIRLHMDNDWQTKQLLASRIAACIPALPLMFVYHYMLES